jgi:anthranilate phosphoribosyltransferase
VDISASIKEVTEGVNLSFDIMVEIMDAMMRGQISEVQIAAFLVAMRMKGETIEEIAAAATIMRGFASSVNVKTYPLVDTCGTGGDGSHTFNISTAAAIVVAACGGHVAKHGNRAASSSSGSADVLEIAGAKIDLSAKQIAECINSVGIGFMFAPSHHAATRFAGKVRKQIGSRTLFNILGPMTNPAGADRQVMGVFEESWIPSVAKVLSKLGTKHGLVVCSDDGMDEISVSVNTHIAEITDGDINTYTINPQYFDLEPQDTGSLIATNPTESLSIINTVFDGEIGPATNIVAANAGAAIYVAGICDSIKSGFSLALDAIQTGRAKKTFNDFILFTKTVKE